jgi:pimeloyl-ACP methyl ester carboxylesterase
MSASFFGTSKEPLFGFYHAPRGARARELGILLCGPGPQEYMRTHWAFRRLAELLSKAGFPAFRFDYFGTGDSAGASGEGSLAIWRQNIATAARELRDTSGARKISAVGFRLGAYLAATSGVAFDELLLWEPVLSGEEYIHELEMVQRAYLQQNPHPPWSLRDRPEELLGAPFPRELERQTRAINMLSSDLPKANRVGVFVSENRAKFQPLVDAWSSRKLATTLREVAEDTQATPDAQFQAAMLSHKMLQAIAAHFG